MRPKNLFAPAPVSPRGEFSEELWKTDAFRVERIVSRSYRSPEGFWYDQEGAEWVVLLAGGATLEFADGEGMVVLKPGDYLYIPAHRRHRIHETDPDRDTVWLAVHY